MTHGTISSSSIYKQFKCQKEREESGAGKKKKLEQHYQSTRPNSHLKTSPLRASEYIFFSNAHGYTICQTIKQISVHFKGYKQ